MTMGRRSRSFGRRSCPGHTTPSAEPWRPPSGPPPRGARRAPEDALPPARPCHLSAGVLSLVDACRGPTACQRPMRAAFRPDALLAGDGVQPAGRTPVAPANACRLPDQRPAGARCVSPAACRASVQPVTDACRLPGRRLGSHVGSARHQPDGDPRLGVSPGIPRPYGRCISLGSEHIQPGTRRHRPGEHLPVSPTGR